MNNVNFVFYHPHLDPVSDRTLRSLLKKFSSLLREVQSQEVIYLINTSDLSASEKQSMRDRLKGSLNHIDAYYLNKLEKGSIEITIVLTSFGIWFLQQTFGESIKTAWKQTEMHRNLVSYLSSDSRKDVLERNIDRVFDNWTLENFLIEDVEKTIDDNGDINVRVTLSTPISVQKRINMNKTPMTLDDIIKESEKQIAKLEATRDDDA